MMNISLTCCGSGFNPRLRAGGDFSPKGACIDRMVFQSTPPRGRRRQASRLAASLLLFQSTPPRGRRPGECLCVRDHVTFQSTPPRGRRPTLSPSGYRTGRVSIHASAREATIAVGSVILERAVSIHASAREATRLNASGSRKSARFNPRLRAGGDIDSSGTCLPHIVFQSTPPRGRRHRPALVVFAQARVSIHASAREATTMDIRWWPG